MSKSTLRRLAIQLAGEPEKAGKLLATHFVKEALVIALALKSQNIDEIMASPCPNCGIKGYISVSGYSKDGGRKAIVKCGLCDYQSSLKENDELTKISKDA